ncbi:MAG: hypothetical protein WBP22_00305 [Candidatus Saccharimonas sp.]
MNLNSIIQWIAATIPTDMDVLVPVSGGSDSAFCFWLCNQALPGRVRGMYFGTSLRCSEWFESVGTVDYIQTDLSTNNPEVTRWAYCLERALRDNLVLVGSHTKTERLLGTYSNASRLAMTLPLAGVWKSDCVRFCEHIGIPDEIINSSRRADIDCGRTEEYAALTFDEVDDFLRQKLGETPTSPINQTNVEYLEKLYLSHAAKRAFPLLGPEPAL